VLALLITGGAVAEWSKALPLSLKPDSLDSKFQMTQSGKEQRRLILPGLKRSTQARRQIQSTSTSIRHLARSSTRFCQSIAVAK